MDPRDAERRRALVELVVDRAHYETIVMGALHRAKVSVWVATANLKDVRLEAPVGTRARARGRYISITDHFVELARRGVEIRILHATLPSGPFRASLAGHPELRPPRFELRRCPRVHLKVIVVDGATLYLGSANFTGAGLGAKGDGRRNFELGLSTDDDVLCDAVQERYESIWSGRSCAGCRLRSECPAPIDQLVAEPAKGPARRRPLSPRPRRR